MTLAIVLVIAAALALVVVVRAGLSRGLQVSADRSLAKQLQPIDVAAFRNLVNSAEDAYLRRKALTTFDWSYRDYTLGITGHFTDGFQDLDVNGNPRRVGSSWIWDLRLSHEIHGEFGSYLKGTTIAVGSLNILDRHPPLDIDEGNNSNNYPGAYYNSYGRRIYVSLDKRF